MSRSLFVRARMLLTKRVFSPKKKNTPRPHLLARTRLWLEALEDRNLLSATGTEPTMLSSMVEAGSYAAQQAMSYLSGYESTVSTLEQIVVNREQQNLLTIFRVESSVEERIEQFIQQALFPTATASSPNSQSSSMGSGPPQVEQANSANLNDSSASEPTAMPVGQAVPIGETSPAGGTIPPAGSFSPSQII